MATNTPNYNLSKPELTDDYKDFIDSYGDNMDIIDQNMGGGGGSGGHTIYDKDGTALAQESGLQFTGAVSVSDDAVNSRTVVNIEGGGNYYLNTLYSTEEKKIGYWTDGKPLYQKTISFNNVAVANDVQLNHNIANLEIAVATQCIMYDSNTGISYDFSVNGDVNTQGLVIGIRVYPTSLWFRGTQSFSASVTRTWFITIRYTKTTDTADPNPQTGGVIYLPTIYSEEEREVGVWKNGKPLYQKIVHIASLPSTTTTTNYAHGIADVDLICNYDFIIRWSNGNTAKADRIQIFNGAFQANGAVAVYVSKTDISVSAGMDRSALSADVIICYTKTTDTAGSGTWTPSGARAVHYSTNEQVIGTYVDGKPLYQKSFQLTTPSTTGSAIVIQNIADLNLETPVNIYGNVLNVPINFIFDYSQNNYVVCFVNTAKTGIAMKIGANIYANQSCNVTLQYTKTTDT